MDHLVNLLVGAHQLKVTIETMIVQLMEKPDYIATILAEIRDLKRVQQNIPIPVEEDPWFPAMFPILCAFRGFFGALPSMENFEVEVEVEEVNGDEDAKKVTDEGNLLGGEDLEEDETSEAEDTN